MLLSGCAVHFQDGSTHTVMGITRIRVETPIPEVTTVKEKSLYLWGYSVKDYIYVHDMNTNIVILERP